MVLFTFPSVSLRENTGDSKIFSIISRPFRGNSTIVIMGKNLVFAGKLSLQGIKKEDLADCCKAFILKYLLELRNAKTLYTKNDKRVYYK